MRLTTTLAAAAALSQSPAVAAQCWRPRSFQQFQNNDSCTCYDGRTVAPTGSVNSGYVVLGLLAALVAASGSF